MDNELKGEGNSVNYRYRMHDPRVGRFFAVDPLEPEYAWNSPYAFSSNRVIDGAELEGLEVKTVINYWDQHQNSDWYVKHTESFVLDGENTNYTVEVINYAVGVGYINTQKYEQVKAYHGGVLSGLKTNANYNYTDVESIKQKRADDEAWVSAMMEKRGFDPFYRLELQQVIWARDLSAPDNQILNQNLKDGLHLLEVLPFMRFRKVARGTPRGFSSIEQFNQAGFELQVALRQSGIEFSRVGVRGSSATCVSSKGGQFRWSGTNKSDVDIFIELKKDIGINSSKNIEGFIHPDKLFKKYPKLEEWSKKWSKELGREVTPGAFKPGTFKDSQTINFD